MRRKILSKQEVERISGKGSTRRLGVVKRGMGVRGRTWNSQRGLLEKETVYRHPKKDLRRNNSLKP